LTTLLLTHPCFAGHITPAGHPERVDRIRAVDAVLREERFAALHREEAPEVDLAAILRCHPEAYVEAIEAANPREGFAQIDSDTVMSQGTWEAVLRGAGAATRAVDAVLCGEADNAFAAIRPPGHHAEHDTAMGFCFVNNAAVAARHAQKAHGLGRVAIIDWDVHHGNGTQDIFWRDASVMYASTHEMPLYPGTGAKDERGDFDTIVNAPLKAGDGGEAFRSAFEGLILPRLLAFRPELVIISAGFDAHWRDPLANINLDEHDFAWATAKLMDLASTTANGRVVSLLEGGYDLQGLAGSVAAHVGVLMGDDVAKA
jgi:acetoin utilization deacetylase AcuC-like enzyme